MKCPGQDSRYWSGEDVFEANCPKCGHSIEFFKDDSQRRCSQCGHRMLNPRMDFGCASYCPYAEQCLGSLPPEMLAQRKDLFKDQIAIAVRRFPGIEALRLSHAADIAALGETLARETEGCNMAVVVAAAHLLALPTNPERHPAAIARDLLKELGTEPDLMEELCEIITAHHQGNALTSLPYRILHDADQLLTLKKRYQQQAVPAEQFEQDIHATLLTPAGIQAARTMLAPSVLSRH